MTDFFAGISIVAFVVAMWLWVKAWRPRGMAEAWLVGALCISVMIVSAGFVLSATHCLARVEGWEVAAVVWCLAALSCVLPQPAVRATLWQNPLPALRAMETRVRGVNYRDYRVWLLLACGTTAFMSIIVNYLLVLVCLPGTPDTHQYHLARIGHYLQQGSLAYYPAGYWAQVIYPKVATVLQLYAYLAGGKLIAMTQFPQFVAYVTCGVVVYLCCRLLAYPRILALLSAAVFSLLTICIAEACTAQNDLLLAAFAGMALAFLLLWHERGEHKHLAACVIALALLAGVKSTAVLVLPSLLIVAVWVWQTRRARARQDTRQAIAVVLGAGVLAVSLLLLPAGYWENYTRYGDPLGPRNVRAEYTNEGQNTGETLRMGGVNALRYLTEMVSLDGLHPLPGVKVAEHRLAAWQQTVFSRLGVALDAPFGARKQFLFHYDRPTQANENSSGWGLFGLLLVWPAVLVALCLPGPSRWFALATVIMAALLCVLIPYDQFHGRFTIPAALFAGPVVAMLYARVSSSWGKVLLSIVTLAGCAAGCTSILFHDDSPLLPYHYEGRLMPSVFTMSVSELLTREAPSGLVANYELLVPENAVVATDSVHKLPEYLFFGEKFTRTVIPLRPFDGPRRPLSAAAQYLIFDVTSPYATPKGIALTTADYPLGILYLRPLKVTPANRSR